MFLNICLPIMKYMGDYPSKQMVPASELSDQIFEPALKEVRIYGTHNC